MQVFLGIDGGGTTTRAVLVDRGGRVLGRGLSGSGNYHNLGLAAAADNIRQAAAGAWEAAGQAPRPADCVFAGCAGIKSGTDIARLTSALENCGLGASGEIRVQNDLHNALAGGLLGRPGIALIAGTGSNCLGRDAGGATWMCGGWGWLLDEPGGAFGLSITAMHAAVRSADGREKGTALLPALLAFLGLSEPNEILARLYVEAWTPDELAAFAPVITRCAREGDSAARKVLRAGAQALSDLVAATANALAFPEGPDIVLLGGCARSGPPYQPMVEDAIRAVCPGGRIVEPGGSPLEGAALNALRAGGVDPLPAIQYL